MMTECKWSSETLNLAPKVLLAAGKRGGPPPDKKVDQRIRLCCYIFSSCPFCSLCSAEKFSVEDFESPGTINGQNALEYSLDSLEDKPWREARSRYYRLFQLRVH